jgi:hypothetical protein
VPTPLGENPAPASATEAPAPKPEAETPPIFKPEQLDQLLAPIALYPDALLAQFLMDDKLDWTEQLGNAVVAQQVDVMDSIQRLRYEAAAAGTLWSNAQQRVTTERQGIVIEPANPGFIYPPVYSPAVYGLWPSPDYPPLDISPPDYGFGLPLPYGIGFGVGFVVVQPLWRWCAFDWGQRRIQLDVDRFNALNRHRPGIETRTWQHDPFRRLSAPSRLAHAVPGVPRSAISAGTIPRMNMPIAAASVPTAVQRSAPPSFSSVGGGLQARIESRSGLPSRQPMMLPIMPRHLPPPIMPRTVARSTASAPAVGVLFGGASHR